VSGGGRRETVSYLMAEAELKGMLEFSVVSTNEGIHSSSEYSNR
jgi:hypothetical protein